MPPTYPDRTAVPPGFLRDDAVFDGYDANGNKLRCTLAQLRQSLVGSRKITRVTNALSPYQVLPTDDIILVDTSGGAVEVDLESAPWDGRTIEIQRTTTDGTLLTIGRNGNPIQNAANNITDQIALLSGYKLTFDTTVGTWWFTAPTGQTEVTEQVV